MPPHPVPADLRPLADRFNSLRGQLQEIDFILQGSVSKRWMVCAGAGCRCRAEPPQRHGPYWDWTRKVKGKTVSVRLTPEEAATYLEWIENRKRFERIVAQMVNVTFRAAEKIRR